MASTYINNSKQFLREFKLHKFEAHTDMAVIGLGGIIEETPVDTGELRDANTGVGKPDYAEWENQAPHAIPVHFGTYKMAPRPFMIRGVMKKSSQIIRAIIRRLRV